MSTKPLYKVYTVIPLFPVDSILAGQRRIFRNVSTVTLPSDIYKWQKHVKEDNMVDYKQQFPRLCATALTVDIAVWWITNLNFSKYRME